MNELNGDYPLFSPILWASATNSNERYPSPSADSGATTMYPLANGVNGRMQESHEPSVELASMDSSTEVSKNVMPPIDAVDIGLVPEDVARAAQEGGPPSCSP
jgi:hypothetical protein